MIRTAKPLAPCCRLTGTSRHGPPSSAPLDQDQRRVVRSGVTPCPLEGQGEVPYHRADLSFRLLQLVHPVDQLVFAELLLSALVFLDQPVGEAEDAIPRVERHFADLRLCSSEADGQGRGAVQAAYDVVAADQKGAGCPALTHWRRPVFVSSRIICAVTKWSGANCSATARSMKR